MRVQHHAPTHESLVLWRGELFQSDGVCALPGVGERH